MRQIGIVTLVATLSGCTIVPPVQEATEEYVQQRRALHSDLTDSAEAWLCRGISVYEWQRRYAGRAQAWQGLCGPGDALPLPTLPIAP